MFSRRDKSLSPVVSTTRVSSSSVLPLAENNVMLRDIYYKEVPDPGLDSVEFSGDDDDVHHYMKQRDASVLSMIIRDACGIPQEYETMISKCFPISQTFIGSNLYADPLYFPCDRYLDSFYTPDSDYYIYATGTYMFIFPEAGVRISGSRDFVDGIPYFKSIVSGRFMEKATTLPIVLSDVPHDMGDGVSRLSFVAGPTVYVCHTSLDSILYDDTGANNVNSISIAASLRHHISTALANSYT
jgi:hypothetical protein